MADDVLYDNKGQYEQIVPMLLDGERLEAVFDCKGKGTGFIAITDKRVMFYDKEFLRKRKTLVSIPFSKVDAVASVDEGRQVFGTTSELVVKAGVENYSFEFRGGDKAGKAYTLIMSALLE